VRISRNPHEVRAWKEAGHTIFFLKPGWTDLTFRGKLINLPNAFRKSFTRPDKLNMAQRSS
jgi:hypothetical protein